MALNSTTMAFSQLNEGKELKRDNRHVNDVKGMAYRTNSMRVRH